VIELESLITLIYNDFYENEFESLIPLIVNDFYEILLTTPFPLLSKEGEFYPRLKSRGN